MRLRFVLAVLVLVVIAAIVFARPVLAWWYDDIGNVALARGEMPLALARFNAGLALSPRSRLLLEDRGRAELDADPASALLDFETADCGAPCVAEMGDAQARLGNADAAVADYLEAKAAARLAAAVAGIAAQGKYEEAIALETALVQRLGDSPLLRADRAAAYATIGRLSEGAAAGEPVRAADYHRAAIAAYQRASELAPLNEGYLLSLGFAQMQWGDARAARAAFRRILALHPHQADAEGALATLSQRKAPTPR